MLSKNGASISLKNRIIAERSTKQNVKFPFELENVTFLKKGMTEYTKNGWGRT